MASRQGNTTLQLHLVGIGKILSSNRLIVPQFQRAYCWKVDREVEDYWTDLSRAIRHRVNEEYFFGTIVLTQDGADSRKKIIDGQQRLVTSSLLIAAIRDELQALGYTRADKIGDAFLASQGWKTDGTEPHLKLNEDDHPPFNGIVTGMSRPALPTKRADSDIVKAYGYFREKLSDLRERHGAESEPEMLKWLSYLEDSAQLAVVETPTEADAYVIFETLNNRGADLTTADLLKNHLFGAAKSANLDLVRNNWHRAVGALSLTAANDKFTKFLRHYWSSKVGKVTERDLYARMRKEVTSSNDALAFSEALVNAARIYAALSDPNHEIWAEKCTSRRPALDYLALFNLVPNKILLLAAVEHLPAAQIDKLLKAMVNWSVRGMIAGAMNRGRFEDLYSQAATEIRKGELKTVSQIRDRLYDLIPSDSEFTTQFSLATLKGGDGNKIARYYLIALEKTAGKEGQPEFVPNDNPNEVNLEHVYPQNASADDWEDFIAFSGNRQDADKLTYRLGNMVLLPSGANSRLGNKPFKEKAEIFERSQLALTREVGKKPFWSPQEIQLRQERLAALAVRTWPR